jgi:hypothetical protein
MKRKKEDREFGPVAGAESFQSVHRRVVQIVSGSHAQSKVSVIDEFISCGGKSVTSVSFKARVQRS